MSPFTGDLHSGAANITTIDPPLFGGVSLTGKLHHYVTFEFEPFVLQSGEYWIGIYNNDSPHGIVGWFWSHTLIDLESDIGTDDTIPGQWRYVSDWQSINPGTAAVDVFGYPTPDTP